MPRIVTYVLELLFRVFSAMLRVGRHRVIQEGKKREGGGVIRENARDMAILSIMSNQCEFTYSYTLMLTLPFASLSSL